MASQLRNDDRVTRRQFLRTGLAAAALPVVQSAQDSLVGGGARGRLRDPSVAGRSRSPTGVWENDPEIQAIEQRLACNCGCTLDVFTCRTTDFSCTYSPALHREVLALRNNGKNAEQILDAFVAKYGEKALMAPKPRGFNLAGYFLPGTIIAAAGAGLVFFIGRRKASVRATSAGVGPSSPATPTSSPEELERLRRALAEIED
jgi:cytochrome c-type biogenesis protein CcmH/NrfF